MLPAIGAARLPLWGGAIWGITAGVAIGLAVFSQFRWIPAVNLGGTLAFIVLVIAVAFPVMDTQRQLPLRQLSLQAAEELLPQEQLVAIGFMKPSITFYLKQNVLYASGPTALNRVVEELTSVSGLPSYLLLGERDDFDNFGLADRPYDLVQEVGAYRLARFEL